MFNRKVMITFFHRNIAAGYSINKVTKTIINHFPDKEEYYMPAHWGGLWVRLKNILYTYKRRNIKGINHVTGDIHYCILGLIGCKSVLTVHDLVWLEYHNFNPFVRYLIKVLYVKLPLMFATKVVAISNETKKDIEKYTHRKDIIVIHNALDESFITVPIDMNTNPKNVLFIGTNKNKNLERTVEALNGFDCVLTIIGKLSVQQLTVLERYSIKYINKIHLSDEEILQEYINSDIVSFVSLYEGFGMPIIEANKVGRPVIASTLPVLMEVGGDSCLYVNPEDINDIRCGFERLFTDESLRNECVIRGLENVKRFDVDSILKKWVCLYESIR